MNLQNGGGGGRMGICFGPFSICFEFGTNFLLQTVLKCIKNANKLNSKFTNKGNGWEEIKICKN
jgi:hypothetical protein